MSVFSSFYAFVGRAGYRLLAVPTRFWLSSTRRVYLIVSVGGEILVIKNWFGRQLWHLPGGGQRRNESAAEAACREAAEELGIGLEPPALKPLASGTWHRDRLDFAYEVLLCELPQKPGLRLKRPEILAAEWRRPSDFNKTDTPAEILSVIHKLPKILQR